MGKKVAQGYRVAYIGHPPPDGAFGDVFFGSHLARRELWDNAGWVLKLLPYGNSTANGVNAALAMQSHVYPFTLDRFIPTASAFM